MDTEDQRDSELSTISAIFPEIQRLNDDDPYTFVLEIPVNPTKAVTVFFPAATEGQVVNPSASRTVGTGSNGNIDSHELAHLPAVRLLLSLPPSYPAEESPVVNISTSPSWLPSDIAKQLEDGCSRLWEELGRDLVVYNYVDHVQQAADDVFGLVSDSGALEIRPEHKIAVLDYDIEAKRTAFENETFECGICLDPKKGAKCHRMMDCGHVFCIQCLQDFYNNAIQEGDLASVRCLEPSCAKEREAGQTPDGKKRRKPKTFISPSELLQVPLESEMVKRYVTLKYKTELESDKNTIYCPRPWCQGAAKSKKHKKPEGFELHEAEDDSDDEDKQTTKDHTEIAKSNPKPYKPEDRLAVCEDCGFAFCSRCYQGWHGDFVVCAPKRCQDELNEEDKASLDFISLHTTPCPTCACPAQKTHGCNHMICYKCQTHFCYLCSAWLDPLNPYQHFNHLPNGRVTSCYMRLWELEEGDENGQNVFAGGRVARQAEAMQQAELQAAVAGGELQDLDRARVQGVQGAALELPEVNIRADQERGVLNGRVGVAHEGPLVLRIDVAPPREDQGQREAVAAPIVRQQAQGRGQNRARGIPGPARHQQPQQHLGQRGRGARGRGRNHLQNPNQRVVQGGQAFARRERHLNERALEEPGQQDQLEDGEAAWVRHFVHLALEDNEHLLDEEE